MDLVFSDTEHEALRHVLDRTVRELAYEIADTDNSRFREQLKAERDVLRGILDRVGGPIEQQTG